MPTVGEIMVAKFGDIFRFSSQPDEAESINGEKLTSESSVSLGVLPKI
jgi:hypothetical protein